MSKLYLGKLIVAMPNTRLPTHIHLNIIIFEEWVSFQTLLQSLKQSAINSTAVTLIQNETVVFKKSKIQNWFESKITLITLKTS